MNIYQIITNPLTKKIFLEGLKIGKLKGKMLSTDLTSEYEIYLDKNYNFSIKESIEVIKIYTISGYKFLTRKDQLFYDIVYDNAFDWFQVYSIKQKDQIFTIGDSITKNGLSKYTIESFRLGSKTTISKEFQYTYYIEVFVEELTQHYFAELNEVSKWVEPIGKTIDNAHIFENNSYFIYSTISKQYYPIDGVKLKGKIVDGYYNPNIKHKGKNTLLILSSKEAINEYKKYHAKEYSLTDIKRIMDRVIYSTGKDFKTEWNKFLEEKKEH